MSEMKKTNNFFLIHNYNTVPAKLLEYCEEYLIIDASDDEAVQKELAGQNLNVQKTENTGHNITSYFTWIAEQIEAETLPEVVVLCKGNMLGRHLSEEYFAGVYNNKWFTYLYEEKAMRDRYSKATAETLERHGGKDPSEGSIASLMTQSRYLEENNSWYMKEQTHPCKYFDDFDDLLRFVYKDPVIPKFISFSPGACYVVRREQLLMHSAAFYRNLNKLQNYTLDPAFPAEAYIIERMMPIFWEENYDINPWMENEQLFDQKLEEAEAFLCQKKEKEGEGRLSRLKRKLLGR